jgi:hypothetical protein
MPLTLLSDAQVVALMHARTHTATGAEALATLDEEAATSKRARWRGWWPWRAAASMRVRAGAMARGARVAARALAEALASSHWTRAARDAWAALRARVASWPTPAAPLAPPDAFSDVRYVALALAPSPPPATATATVCTIPPATDSELAAISTAVRVTQIERLHRVT